MNTLFFERRPAAIKIGRKAEMSIAGEDAFDTKKKSESLP